MFPTEVSFPVNYLCHLMSQGPRNLCGNSSPVQTIRVPFCSVNHYSSCDFVPMVMGLHFQLRAYLCPSLAACQYTAAGGGRPFCLSVLSGLGSDALFLRLPPPPLQLVVVWILPEPAFALRVLKFRCGHDLPLHVCSSRWAELALPPSCCVLSKNYQC